jgi:dihydroxyacetone kinase-like predicted kinase
MPIQTINASKVIGQTLIATQNVDYFYPFSTKLGTIKKGDIIGVVYSYVMGNNNELFWMIDKGYNKFIYVKHDVNKLTLVNGNQVLQDIKNQQQQQLIEQKGLLQYYLDKYLPYIVGGVVIYFALPTIKKTFTNEK